MGITQIYAQCYQCTGTNSTSFSIGTGVATGNNSFAGGNLSGASGNNSFVFGSNAFASQIGGIAFGNSVNSAAANSYVFGQNLSSGAVHSITIGMGSSSSSLLSNSKAGSIYSDHQGFKFNCVSRGDEIQRMIISKDNGSDGIGVATPQEKLHVSQNILSDGNMISKDKFVLAPDNLGNNCWEISRTATGLNYAYKTSSQKDVLFLGNDGNMGIGVTTPPLTNMQIGDIWTFQNASGKQNIGRNTYFNGAKDVRIQQGAASRITFNNSGEILLQTTSSGAANATIIWNTVTFSNSGNVGIGTTTTPQAKLEVAGDFKAQDADIAGNLTANSATITTLSMDNLTAKTATITGSSTLMGNVTVGTTSQPANLNVINGALSAKSANITGDLVADSATITNLTTATLNLSNTTLDNLSVITLNAKNAFVNGKIKTKEIEVTVQGWGDHVFAEDYNLMPLNEVAQYIKENSHLPEIPSAKEVVENGIELGGMQRKLIMKIEELTLYILQQNQQLIDLQNQINELKNSKP